eukprot:scaffold6708_cov134-Cylindrotheca_fusiformis.AAC.2
MSSLSIVATILLLAGTIHPSEQRLRKTKAPTRKRNRLPPPTAPPTPLVVNSTGLCSGPPPAEDVCIHVLAHDSDGNCTGLKCVPYEWYECFDGSWAQATMGIMPNMDLNCAFEDLHAVCDCPGQEAPDEAVEQEAPDEAAGQEAPDEAAGQEAPDEAAEQEAPGEATGLCSGPPPAEDVCIQMLSYDSDGTCTGLKCVPREWYDCFEGSWTLATMGIMPNMDPNCAFEDLHTVCDCPGQ